MNIPVYRLPPKAVRSGGTVFFYGVSHIIPMVAQWPGTVIAINLGGAVIPALLSIYLIVKNRLYFPSLAGVTIAAAVFHHMAHAVPGIGIALPVLVPALVAIGIAIFLSWEHAPAMAYIVGTLGTLIGADLTNLKKIQGLGAPVASIGGAGTFDSIFLIGIMAVLLAGLMKPRMTSQP